MISRISGRLELVASDRVMIDTGVGLWYEVLVLSCDREVISVLAGQDIVLHTIHYFEGDPTRGQQIPRLIGFFTEDDRDFFRLFTTVKGLGVRKSLRALSKPAGEVASAIYEKDVIFIKSLPEIGQKTAERIITELHDKVANYVASSSRHASVSALPAAGEEAVSVLVQLGERKSDAVSLVQRVLDVTPDIEAPEQIIQHVYRLKTSGRE